MGLEQQRNTIARAEQIAIQRETAHLEKLSDLMGNKTKGAVQEALEKEVKRLKPQETFDHEEVFASGNIYTNGRKDGSKVRLSQIKTEKWAQTGE